MTWLERLRNHIRLTRNHDQDVGQRLEVLAVMPLHPVREEFSVIARREGWLIEYASTIDLGVDILRSQEKPIVICDRDLPASDWRAGLATISAAAPTSVILLASAAEEENLWEEVVELGGYDVVLKPLEHAQVVQTVDFAWRYWKFNHQPAVHYRREPRARL
jgi:DNA-binding response OmpR family regulator